MRHDYWFRKMTRADYPLLRRWLAQPHVAVWWGDADTELALFSRDIDGGETDMRIVELDGRPFAYVQDYGVDPVSMPQYAGLPHGSRGLDTFLGNPAYLGQGHGSGYLGQRAQQLLTIGAPLVAVDPSPGNDRAIAAYDRAGFRRRSVETDAAGDRVQVMTIARQQPATPPN